MSVSNASLEYHLAGLNTLLEPPLSFAKNYSSILDNESHGNSEGKYDIDYNALIVKRPGFAYKKIVSWSDYKKSPGSPIDGDASR